MEPVFEEAAKVEREYKEGLDYQKQMGFHVKWPQYERFKAGDQWPPPTPATKDLPRPVFNIIKQIEDHKVSSVMNENIKMVYSVMDIADQESKESQAADMFTKYSDSVWENIKQDQLNEEALESASNLGCGIWHYYWDSAAYGGNTLKYIGEMCGETIDPVNFFPGNPQNSDIQKQPYIIITSRDLVANVRAEAIANGLSPELAKMIVGDKETNDQAYDMAKQELSGSNKVTVLTKYWKEEIKVVVEENGQRSEKDETHILFMRVASGVVIKDKTDTTMRLYPIAIMQWERRKRSIFGIGDTEGIIPNQKAINFLMGMQLLSVQLTGWPKLLIDKTKVRQAVSNKPGEIINVDGGQGLDNAISYMTPAQMPNDASNLTEMVMSVTKDVTGANDSSLGQTNTANLNASAIMLLQKAAGISIDAIRRRFYQAMEDTGRIWEEFWKIKYNTTRNVVSMGENDEKEVIPFKFSDWKDLEMDLKIDVGPASAYSESLMMNSLDKLFDSQQITLKQYLEFSPRNVVPFKDRLLKDIQEQEVQGLDINSLLQQLSPEEQKAYQSASPKMQQQIIQQLQQETQQMQPDPQQQQAQQQMPQQAPPPMG